VQADEARDEVEALQQAAASVERASKEAARLDTESKARFAEA